MEANARINFLEIGSNVFYANVTTNKIRQFLLISKQMQTGDNIVILSGVF